MLTNRFSIIIALGAIAALALFTISMVAQPRSVVSSNANAYLAQRLGEWTAGVTSEQAYLEQRHEEQTTGHASDAQQAYLEYRHGEQTTGNAANAQDVYRQFRQADEASSVNPVLAYLNYRRGEWSGK